jgi:hypothetical protein
MKRFFKELLFSFLEKREPGLHIAQVQPTAELTEQGCSKEDHPSIRRQLTQP